MKKLIFSCLLSVLFFSATNAQYGTERTGYEGDYFSLEGALELFKQSHSIRDFERKINTEDKWVNNLDLDYDGRTDYIRVEHKRKGDFHAIILQVPIDRYNVQDVAVIEIEVIGRREAILQIIGDEDLYGEEVVVEPIEGYSNSRGSYDPDYGDYVNVYYWRPVQYILGKQYRTYVSPYRWQYYPTWWSPWRQCAWDIFRPRIVIYHRHYHVVHHHRVVRVHNFYRPYRSYSHHVVHRSNEVRVSYGKQPIHRPGIEKRTYNEYKTKANNVERGPRNVTRSSTPTQRPAVSRKTPANTLNQKANRSTNPKVSPNSRNTTTRPNTTRKIPTQRPSVNSRKTTPSVDQKSTRSTSPKVSPRSSTTSPRQRTTRSATPTRRPSASSRTAPSTRQKSSRSTTPSRSSSKSRKGGGL